MTFITISSDILDLYFLLMAIINTLKKTCSFNELSYGMVISVEHNNVKSCFRVEQGQMMFECISCELRDCCCLKGLFSSQVLYGSFNHNVLQPF